MVDCDLDRDLDRDLNLVNYVVERSERASTSSRTGVKWFGIAMDFSRFHWVNCSMAAWAAAWGAWGDGTAGAGESTAHFLVG